MLRALVCLIVSLLLDGSTVYSAPTFDPQNASEEELLAAYKKMAAELDDQGRAILDASFNVFHDDPNNRELWAQIQGKTLLELLQHAAVLRNRNNQRHLEVAESSLSYLRESLDELQQAERPDLERIEATRKMIEHSEGRIQQIQTIGFSVISQQEIESRVVSEKSYQASLARLEALKGRWKTSLYEVIKGSDRIQFSPGSFPIRGIREGIVYEVEGTDKVDRFLDAVSIAEPDSRTYCFCHGDFIMDFLKNGQSLAKISFHHGTSLSWIDGSWEGHAPLTESSTNALKTWLSEIGFRE